MIIFKAKNDKVLMEVPERLTKEQALSITNEYNMHHLNEAQISKIEFPDGSLYPLNDVNRAVFFIMEESN